MSAAPASSPASALKQPQGGSADQNARFVLRLASAVAAGTLQAWLTGARDGDRVEYANGIDLPQAEPGVVLVARWIDAGLVRTFRQRDPADQRRWRFIAERTSRAPRGAGFRASAPPAPSPTATRETGRASRYQRSGHCAASTRDQSEALLQLLRGRAATGKPCPTFAETVELLGLRDKRRASYLFDKLAADRRIAVTWAGPGKGRVVTILAKGRAQGKSTAGAGA